MRSLQKLSTATPDTIRQEMLQTVEHLLRTIRRDQDVLDKLQQVRDLLDSLPLASDDYSTAANRLRNAHRYLVSQERGAAGYGQSQADANRERDDSAGQKRHAQRHGDLAWCYERRFALAHQNPLCRPYQAARLMLTQW